MSQFPSPHHPKNQQNDFPTIMQECFILISFLFPSVISCVVAEVAAAYLLVRPTFPSLFSLFSFLTAFSHIRRRNKRIKKGCELGEREVPFLLNSSSTPTSIVLCAGNCDSYSQNEKPIFFSTVFLSCPLQPFKTFLLIFLR